MEKYYVLSDNIYMVNGGARSAIYDFNHNLLYSVSRAVRDLTEKLSKIENYASQLNEEQKVLFTKLIGCNLIRKNDKQQPIKNIKEDLKRDCHVDFAWVEVTRRCNLSCNFCYEGSNPYCTETMSFDDFTKVVHQLKELDIPSMQFIGGEPMILKDTLKQMIDYASNYFGFIELYTNGVLLDEQWCEFLKSKKINVAISIHSYLPEEHDKVTQVKGSHRRVIRGLNLLKKYNIPYRIGTVKTRSCSIGNPSPTDVYTLQPKLPKVASHAEALDFDFEMFKKKAITKQTKKFPVSKEIVIQNLSGHQCFSHEIYISSLLEVYPCVMERRKSYGNLKQKHLKDIINHNIRFMTKDDVEGCQECEYRYSCFDCRPDSKGASFYSKPWFCSYNPKTGEWHDLDEMYKHHLKGKKKIVSIPIVQESIS